MKRDVLNSPRLFKLKKKRQRVFLNKILLSLFAFFMVFAGLAYISRISVFNIKGVEITNNKVVDTEIIKTIVEKEIKGNYLWVFPKTNILFYPKNDVKKELYNQFNRLRDVNLKIKDEKILEVSITERTALYIWCGSVLPETNVNQKCYFVDETGFIFDEAPYFSGEVYFKFYGLADVGTYFIKENFEQLIRFKDTLITMGFKPVSLYISADENVKIFLSTSNKTQTEPYIALKIDADFQNLAENLETALGTEPLSSDFKNKYSSLEYIDLRFGNKVYYKFR